jgi:N-formylglutamate amidohydrolase
MAETEAIRHLAELHETVRHRYLIEFSSPKIRFTIGVDAGRACDLSIAVYLIGCDADRCSFEMWELAKYAGAELTGCEGKPLGRVATLQNELCAAERLMVEHGRPLLEGKAEAWSNMLAWLEERDEAYTRSVSR